MSIVKHRKALESLNEAKVSLETAKCVFLNSDRTWQPTVVLRGRVTTIKDMVYHPDIRPGDDDRFIEPDYFLQLAEIALTEVHGICRRRMIEHKMVQQGVKRHISQYEDQLILVAAINNALDVALDQIREAILALETCDRSKQP